MIEAIAKDSKVDVLQSEIEGFFDVKELIGRAPNQVLQFLKEEVRPLLKSERSKVKFPKVEV